MLRHCKATLIFEVLEFIAVRELEHVIRFAKQIHALGHLSAFRQTHF